MENLGNLREMYLCCVIRLDVPVTSYFFNSTV